MLLYGIIPIPLAVACLFSAVLSGFIATGLIRTFDHESIASVRRFFGLLFAATLIWLVPLAVSLPLSSLIHGAVASEFIFGGFLAWGFELVIINGAFLRSLSTSLLMAAIHPVPIMLLVLSASHYEPLFPLVSGVLVMVTAVVFLSHVDSINTENGISSLQILRAFLKTWVEGKPAELEGYFLMYAQRGPVTTYVIIAKYDLRELVIVLPGIHPGPFSPVGSYNLSELIHAELKGPNTTTVVLHGTGGHERNVPTNKITSDYVAQISQFVKNQKATGRVSMQGPLWTKIGITNIITLAFGKDVLTIVSNSPYLSDDLDPNSIVDASNAASDLGLRAMVVDAHNSVNGENKPQRKISREEWKNAFSRTMQLDEMDFRLGAANSGEVSFKPGLDISDGGISVVLFATRNTRCVLVSADSNNAISELRERIGTEMSALGISLLELCTSDTHKFAARNLTSRGYFALGEQTSPESIITCIKELVSVAEGRLAQCNIQTSTVRSEAPLIGEESLHDFALLTKNAITTSKRFTKVMIPVFLLLLAISLLY